MLSWPTIYNSPSLLNQSSPYSSMFGTGINTSNYAALSSLEIFSRHNAIVSTLSDDSSLLSYSLEFDSLLDLFPSILELLILLIPFKFDL